MGLGRRLYQADWSLFWLGDALIRMTVCFDAAKLARCQLGIAYAWSESP